MRILVTGGAGFIGSAVCRHLVNECGHDVVNIDCLTYASTSGSTKELENDLRYAFVKCDIRDSETVLEVLRQYEIGAVMHLAAESHVDRSIDGPGEFMDTNIIGTFRLLNAVLDYWSNLKGEKKTRFASTISPQMKSLAISHLMTAPSVKLRPTRRRLPIPHPRQRRTIWFKPGTKPMACRW